MIKILFICHGNICRSPMAEFVLKDLVHRQRIDQNFQIDSAATSREELGNDIHRGTKAKLREVGVPFEKRCARQIDRNDYDFYDYIIVMDDENLRGLRRILGPDREGKIHKLLSFAGEDRDIADPWYTGNFDQTYEDILQGLTGFLKTIQFQAEK